MKKKVIALSVALLLFAGNSMTTLAAVCPHSGAPGGVHDFVCRPSGMGYMKDLGTHEYLFGYVDGKPIYRDGCRLTQSISYCSKVCRYCGYELENSQHCDEGEIRHSINHD